MHYLCKVNKNSRKMTELEQEQGMTDVGDRIKKVMEWKQMSQQDFAQTIKMSPASLSSIFNGRTKATLNHAMAIHSVYPEIRTDWLLYNEGEMLESGAEPVQPAEASPTPQGMELAGDLFASQQQPRAYAAPVPHPSSSGSADAVGKRSVYAAPTDVIKPVEVPVKRNVKEIRVFYDDGTYESFVPSK